MTVCPCISERDGVATCLSRWLDVRKLMVGVVGVQPRFAQTGLGGAVAGVDSQRFPEHGLGALEGLRGEGFEQIAAALEEVLVGLGEGGAMGGEGALLVGAEGDVERRRGSSGELVLDGEHVADWRGDRARGEGARLAGRFVRLADGVGRVDQVAVAGERERQCGGGAEFLRGLRGRGDLPVFELAGREDSDVVVDTEVGEALGQRFGEAAAEGGEFGVLCRRRWGAGRREFRR